MEMIVIFRSTSTYLIFPPLVADPRTLSLPHERRKSKEATSPLTGEDKASASEPTT